MDESEHLVVNARVDVYSGGLTHVPSGETILFLSADPDLIQVVGGFRRTTFTPTALSAQVVSEWTGRTIILDRPGHPAARQLLAGLDGPSTWICCAGRTPRECRRAILEVLDMRAPSSGRVILVGSEP